MIAIAKRSSKRSSTAWHQGFLVMLPSIRRYAMIAFRALAPSAREEAVQEVICNALVAYRRLHELGKTEVAFPTVLARYGVAQFRAGRRVGCSLNVRDIMSVHCQRRKQLEVERLDKFDHEEMAWQEILVEDRHAGPAETAASRIDFSNWLRSLSRRRRQVATILATGETTAAVARRFCVSPGRVSQLRRELYENWNAFGTHHTPAAMNVQAKPF